MEIDGHECGQLVFLKINIFLLKINIFFYVLNHFDGLILKIILKKLKKYYFDTFQHEKHF